MNKLLLALLATLVFGPAQAADNAIVLTPGVGVTERSVDVGSGVQAPGVVIVNGTGTNIATSPYGTAPSAITVPAFNTFVTNTNPNGQATMANSSPVVISSDQTSIPVSGTVTANAGTNLNTSALATSANQPTNAAQGSTTSGQTGRLVLGAVTTAAPTYTTAQSSPLSLDTAGNLRVNVVAGGGSGGTSSTFGSAFPGTGTAIGLTNGTNMVAWSATTNYGTAPAAIAVPAVNAFITNTNANGPTTMANGAPVTIGGGNVSAPISISTATTTQLVALSGSTKIYVMSWDVIAGGTGNITLEYGTGSSCGTGTTLLTGAYPLTAQAGLVKGNGAAPVLIVPAGNALCALTSAAVQMLGSLAYQQF